MAKINYFIESELVFKEKPNRCNFDDLTGRVFSRLTVIGYEGCKKRKSFWYCRCVCDKITKVWAMALKNGNTNSCGCFQMERIKETMTTHNHASNGGTTLTYQSWHSMYQRCNNPNDLNFSNYGGRGIKVYEKWLKFENFLADMGERVSKEFSLDRINNDGDYCPGNCRWATRIEQSNNKRNTRLLTYNGKTQTLSQWADEIGMNRSTISYRIKSGWPIERAFTTNGSRIKSSLN